MGTELVTAESIGVFRLLAIRQAVKLEVLGMKRSGRPATVIAREILGLPKSTPKAAVLAAMDAKIEELR